MRNKINKFMKKYLQSSFCQYELCDYSGKHNRGFNIWDAVLLLLYIGITIYTVWSSTVRPLTFFATIILIGRYIIGFIRKTENFTTDKYEVVLTYYFRVILLSFISVCLFIVYFSSEHNVVINAFLTVYYTVFAIFEITDVLADCYSARPRLYERKRQKLL